MVTSGYEAALESWIAGDAERALTLCDALQADEARSVRATLLRARVLLRMRKPREAVALLEALPLAGATADESATAAMLLGTACARGGDVARGLALLHDAALRAANAGVETAIRSEIALGIALAFYQRREFERAATALDGVDPESGVVYARALECRGWIAKSRSEFAAACEAFEAALAQLDRSHERDRFLEANLVGTLAYIAVEVLDFARWEAMLVRARTVPWDAVGLEYNRFWLEMTRSMADEIAGRPREALQAARNAGLCAPSPAFRAFAECRRASVLFAYGELLGYEDLAASIRAELDATDVRALHEFEEINLPAMVAETLAVIGDGPGAAAALRRLDEMSPAQLALLRDEGLKRAYLAFVEGLVADANNDALRAQHRYREALRAFSEMGLTRRALLAALPLSDLSGEETVLAFIAEQVRGLPASSWVRTKATRRAAWFGDAVLAGLTRAEREIVQLLHAGHSTAEIAAIRGRSPQTIRNTISKLLQTFGVGTRQALISECARRGVFPPAP
ncbi:MAG TPA: LuxR C-terminal-related transcriptional regulator [Candidatus Elarobacter sp.]|jgi:DNA-binding CsgD family transcriptional regulator/tetratricopeptide (TPR) repeat protein|nr:LuxR C-terminal-related transcriptional regulator [Candidatus Elarobacter sp.]